MVEQLAGYYSDSSSDDSFFEFELNSRRPKSALSMVDDETPRSRLAPRVFDSEYYSLPPLENLSLSSKPDKQSLQPMGTVFNVIDFVVTIKANENAPSFDYDTVLFTEDAEVIGSIFEIFGLINDPMYGIRFNNADEAKMYQPGAIVMYAPDDYELTHKTVLDSIMSKSKPRDDADDGDDPDFSDDEAERQHTQKVRAKNRTFTQQQPSYVQQQPSFVQQQPSSFYQHLLFVPPPPPKQQRR